jgi:moderate conductance mechanosensitive channel
VLRDSEGTAHFIPHGSITTVSNMSHGWSAAFLEILIAFKEDVDRVANIIKQLGKELRQDPAFAPAIQGDLEMAGLDRLENSGMILQFSMKTLPLKQWDVKRELLRRIKKKFDELGIEIPVPQRAVYVHHANGAHNGDGAADEEHQLAGPHARG